MNNTNENNNFENEVIETTSNVDETQNTENSETTESPIYYIPYYENGCLCWRRNDGGGVDDNAALPITIGDNPVVTPIYAINCEDDMYYIAENKGVDLDYKEFNIINYGSDFYFSGKDGGDYQNHGIIHYGDIYVMNTYNHIITNLYEYKNESIKEGDGALFSFFDKDTDDLNYSVVMNSVNGINRMNNVCNVRGIGAKGDGETDDTDAFKAALKNNRCVYVPGGTYKITGELEVGDNCELELAQDAVLEFDPAYFEVNIDENRNTITRNVDSPKNVNEVLDDPETFRCIILKMSSSLIGNHATIRVPYDFKGSVIYASTRSHPEKKTFDNIAPFKRHDPQWKPARYLKDINIVKPIDDGMTVKVYKTQEEIDEEIAALPDGSNTEIDIFKHENLGGYHASVKNTCNGTAVYIEGHRNRDPGCSSHLWGLEFTGLRIAGAFVYGIYGKNNSIYVDANGKYIENPDGVEGAREKWAWTNDMKINGIVDGCKIGVYLEHCNHAFISTIIQPRTAYFDADASEKPPYAEYGIHLNECINVDLTGSRVWDWNATNTKWVEGGENQHLRLDGDCYGLILDDFSYYEMDDYDIRDLIYTKYTDNYNNMTILQESVSKYFDMDKNTFKYGFDRNRKIHFKDINDESDTLENGDLKESTISSTTSFIPCSNKTSIKMYGFNFDGVEASRIAFYGENKDYMFGISIKNYLNKQNNDYKHWYISEFNIDNDNTSNTELVFDNTDNRDSYLKNVKYIKICCDTKNISDGPYVVNGGKTYAIAKNHLKDGVCIKECYVEGLEDKYVRLNQTTSVIDINSTDNQYPTAKAVYELIKPLL